MSDNVSNEVQMEWIAWDDWIDFDGAADDSAGDWMHEWHQMPEMPEASLLTFTGQDTTETVTHEHSTLQHSTHGYTSFDSIADWNGNGIVIAEASEVAEAIYRVPLSRRLHHDNDQIEHNNDLDMTLMASPEPLSESASVEVVDELQSPERGARAVATHREYQTERPGEALHDCRFEHCGRKKPFARKADLERHINAKHRRTISHICPAKGCFKKQHRTTFSRIDKLMTHLRAMHDSDTLAKCPTKICTSTEMTLIELYPHIHHSHTGASFFQGGIRHWYCPIKPCKVGQGHKNLWNHMMEHFKKDGVAQMESIAHALLKKNPLLLAKTSCLHRTTSVPGFLKDCACPITGLEIVCPLCQECCKDAAAFEDHMLENHLIQPSQQRHFQEWKAYCQRASRHNVFRPADGDWWFPGTTSRNLYLTCPSCGCTNKTARLGGFTSHHRSMWRTDLNDLKRFRLQILELYPSFGSEDGWMPVWKDLAKP